VTIATFGPFAILAIVNLIKKYTPADGWLLALVAALLGIGGVLAWHYLDRGILEMLMRGAIFGLAASGFTDMTKILASRTSKPTEVQVDLTPPEPTA